MDVFGFYKMLVERLYSGEDRVIDELETIWKKSWSNKGIILACAWRD
jgi:hypothetical protein